MTQEEKIKVALETRAKLNKAFGSGTVMSLSEKPNMEIDTISTGSLSLNIALGIGGLPRGRIVEVYGPESSGKTTICIHTIAEAQKKGGICAIIDAEHAFDKYYAEKLGVDLSRLDINQPESGDQGLEIADRLISSGAYDVVVVDSVSALVPKSELEGDMGDSKMGKHALLMSQACRKLVGVVKRTNTLLIFTNQLRNTIGSYGNPEVTSGGLALRFYASVRLDIRRSTTMENSVVVDNVITGNLTRVKVVKNKCAPPFSKCEFDILYGVGVDKIGEVIAMACELGILKKWGKVITYHPGLEDESKHETETFGAFLTDNVEFYEMLRGQILNKVGVKED